MDTNFRLKSSFHRSPLSRKRARERERGSIIARNFYRKRLDYASVANTKKVGTWNLGSKDSNRIFNFRTRKRFDGTRFDFVENENGRERKETIANHGKSPPRYRVTIILMPDSVTPSSHPPTKITQSARVHVVKLLDSKLYVQLASTSSSLPSRCLDKNIDRSSSLFHANNYTR